ncbi:hypothetical protein BDV19DRAFT_395763 [Aspergillus venezuelensis]
MHEKLDSQAADTCSRVIELLQEIVNTGAAFDFECDEFCAIISRLCTETPDFARSLQQNIANTILKSPTRPKRRQEHDPSYRPPKNRKSAPTQAYSANTNKGTHLNAKDTTTESAPQASSSTVAERITQGTRQNAGTHQNTKDTTTEAASQASSSGLEEKVTKGTRQIAKNTTTESTPQASSSYPAVKSVSFTADDAIITISEITKHQGGPLVKEIHACILHLLEGKEGATAGFNSWLQLLDTTHFESKRRDIFKFLEYLGASDWYEKKINLAIDTAWTKEGKLVERRGAAIHVLKEVLKNDNPGTETKATRRNRLNTHFTRGRRLRSLTDKFGRGILFHTKIWTWIKSKEESEESFVHLLKAKLTKN